MWRDAASAATAFAFRSLPHLSMTTSIGRPFAFGIAIAGLLVTGFTSTAGAHPHDILAQCQLPSGKWVMCDETVHDTLTGQHVPKESTTRPGKLKVAPQGNTGKLKAPSGN
jgi:hypothetical protein